MKLNLSYYIDDAAAAHKLNEAVHWLDHCIHKIRDLAALNDPTLVMNEATVQTVEWQIMRANLVQILQYRKDKGIADTPMIGAFLSTRGPDYLKYVTDPKPQVRTLRDAQTFVPLGLYQGWKGHIVLVTGHRKDSESTEPRVDYIELTNADGSVVTRPEPWSRLLSDWLQEVNKTEYRGPRFTRITEGMLQHLNYAPAEAACCTPEPPSHISTVAVDGLSHLFTRRLGPQ